MHVQLTPGTAGSQTDKKNKKNEALCIFWVVEQSHQLIFCIYSPLLLLRFLILQIVEVSFEISAAALWCSHFLPGAQNPTREVLHSRRNPDACNPLKVEFVAMKNNDNFIPIRGKDAYVVTLFFFPRISKKQRQRATSGVRLYRYPAGVALPRPGNAHGHRVLYI